MVVPVEEISRFVKEVMIAVGTEQEHAEQMADLLVAADCRGHFSHGLNRLGKWRVTQACHGIY
jgi:LDH2 family malate/lactate/ureidoglycolate dehydrogenase